MLTINAEFRFNHICVVHVLAINGELTKFIILELNPDRLHHIDSKPNFFYAHHLSFNFSITTGTNNRIGQIFILFYSIT